VVNPFESPFPLDLIADAHATAATNATVVVSLYERREGVAGNGGRGNGISVLIHLELER